ncbi:MAG: hypothetical protein AAGL49_15205, partial [Pseudomonadota bacterium]
RASQPASRPAGQHHAQQGLAPALPRAPLARADEVLRPVPPGRGARHPRDVRVIPKSRDFH